MAKTPPLIKPRPLREGDVVRVIAPASPFDGEALASGVEVLEGWGFRVRMRDDITQVRSGYLAGSPRRRAEELHEAFDDDEAAAVIAVRGGYGVTTALPLFDPDRLTRSPKALVGCSDLTALLNFAVSAGLTAIHGPMVGALGRGKDPDGAQRLQAMLTGTGRPAPLRSALDDPYAWCIAPGVARGRSVGGSLSLLAATCGTPFQTDARGCVLFLEDVGERPYRIDRLLTQIEQAGLLDGVAAVVLGDMVGCDEPGGTPTWRDAVDRVLRRHSVPVLAGLPFGHGQPNLAVPLGVDVQVDAGAGSVTFREAPLA